MKEKKMKTKSKTKQNGSSKREKYISMLILTVLTVIFSLTPIGYINTSHASLTLLPCLVVIGSAEYGIGCGAYLGTLFGISSFLHCFTPSYTFGQAFLQISPLLTAIVCILPRMLTGLCCGSIKKLFSHDCSAVFSNIVTSFAGGLLNTVFFVTALLIVFGDSAYLHTFGSNLTQIIRTLINRNSYIEWIACTFAGTLVPYIKAAVMRKDLKKIQA